MRCRKSFEISSSTCLFGSCDSDGTIRKTCKSNLYGTAMYDLVTVDKTYLPGHDVMNTYFLDLAATVATQLKHYFTVSIYFVCNTCRQKIIKNAERLYVVVVSDIS